ncbi:cellulose synthase [Rhizobium sp. KVB221]|uniref:Cellulose synthase n=1 Tax=Rhizobium setariae TaxID=2801340 RepID=A0A936YQ37_9HYPH|nr:cellulose synthase [Rhizobium setariae]MBL0372154.1 cellulose synthase [Rhizobium setariae]
MKSTILTFTGTTALTVLLAASNADFIRSELMGNPTGWLAKSTAVAKGERIVAQAEPAQQPAEPAKKPVVDESALRYFASKGDKARLEAEIARLRALYPDWVPPADPLAVPENSDRQLEAMWALYSQSKFAELHKAINDRQVREPGWTPPSDLTERLAVAEKRLALISASDAKQYADVVTIGSETPSLLTCSDVDVLWRVAEAFAKTDRLARADDAYTYILKNCTKTPERIATIQKAAAVLGYEQMQALLLLEKTLPDGKPEFEPVLGDLARRFVAEGGKDDKLVVAQSYLDLLRKDVEKQANASDALLLGWHYIKRSDMAEAERYFRTAHDITDTASAAQGLALTLIARKDAREAENVMYRWRDASAEASATYFAATANLLAGEPPPVLDQEVLRRIAAAVTEKKEVRTAEQFGWYALAFRQPKTASQWFRMTLGWKADYEPAAYGLAVARLQLKDMAGVRQIQNVWAGRSERIARVSEPQREKTAYDTIPLPDSTSERADRISRVEPVNRVDADTAIDEVDDYARRESLPESRLSEEPIAKSPRRAVVSAARPAAGCRTTVDPEMLHPDVAIGRGWCLMNLKRPLEAASAFGVALRSASAKIREDAAYGQSLAYLRAGLVNDAAVSATKAKQRLSRAVELQTAILSNRATDAFDAGRYRETVVYLNQLAQLQTERTDLLVLRAYAYRKLNRRADALTILEALAATGNRDAVRGLAEIRAEDYAR